MRNKFIKKHFSLFLRIAVSVGLLYYLFNNVPYSGLKNIYANADIRYLLAGFCLFYISLSIGLLRWHYILKGLSVDVSLSALAATYLSSMFFNLFCPSIVAGDVFRGASLGIRCGDTNKVAASVLVDRVNGAFALAMVAFVFSFFGIALISNLKVFLGILLLCGCIFAGTAGMFSRRMFNAFTFFFNKSNGVYKKLLNLHEHLYFFREKPKAFIKTLLYFSLPIQILTPVAFYLFARGFGITVSFVSMAILVPICMAIALMPIAIAGLGIRESAVVYFFAFMGIPKDISMGMSLLNGFALILAGILGGIFYVTIHHRCLQCDA